MVGRFLRLLFLAVLAMPPARAWDEVSHGHVTELAIEQVRDPELRAFLRAHRDEVISGSWFPDWIYKAHVRHKGREHNIYLDAVWADLQNPAVKRGKEYGRYLAHFMGAYAHVVEDRTLDKTVGAYAEDVGDHGRDDMELGLVNIATYRYLRRDFIMSLPVVDLKRVYRNNAYFDDGGLNDANFEAELRDGLDKQNLENRLLKFLSFLTADWARRAFPFAADNMATAPGGFNDNARAVAAVWEAIWARAHGRAAPLFVFSLPSRNGALSDLDHTSALGWVLVVASQRIDLTRLTPQTVMLRGERSGAVETRIVAFPKPDELHDVAFLVAPAKRWVAGERYHLTVDYRDAKGRAEVYRLDFQAPDRPRVFATRSHPRPFVFGLWGAALLFGLGGMFFGAPGALALAVPILRRQMAGAAGVAFRTVVLICRTVGVTFAITAVWFLATNGEWLIEYLRHHH